MAKSRMDADEILDNEFAVAGGLLDDPARCAPVAWAHLTAADFIYSALCEAVFNAVIGLWHGCRGDWPAAWPSHGHIPDVALAVAKANHLNLPTAHWQVSSLLIDYGAFSGPHTFEWYVLRLAAQGAQGRFRLALVRWALAAQRGLMSRTKIAECLRDLRCQTRRLGEAPPSYPAVLARSHPKQGVGHWA
jgi:hypothetical protein